MNYIHIFSVSTILWDGSYSQTLPSESVLMLLQSKTISLTAVALSLLLTSTFYFTYYVSNFEFHHLGIGSKLTVVHTENDQNL